MDEKIFDSYTATQEKGDKTTAPATPSGRPGRRFSPR